MTLIKPSVKIQDNKGHGWNFVRKRQKMNSFLLQIEEENVQKGKIGSELGFSDFRGESVPSL